MKPKGANRDLVEEFCAAFRAGYKSQTAAAAEMGVPRSTLSWELRKAREAGDERLLDLYRTDPRRRYFDPLDVVQATAGSAIDPDDAAKVIRLIARQARDSEDEAMLLDEILGVAGGAA